MSRATVAPSWARLVLETPRKSMAQPSPAPDERSERAPRRTGRYTLFDQIASGAMATVHLGRLHAASGFGRVVAIKRAHPHVTRDADLAATFVSKALVSAKIQDSNLVSVLDLVDANGELWLVMEYVHGAALTSLLQLSAAGAGVPLRIACSISVGMLLGLHAAHEAKSAAGASLDIIHRARPSVALPDRARNGGGIGKMRQACLARRDRTLGL